MATVAEVMVSEDMVSEVTMASITPMEPDFSGAVPPTTPTQTAGGAAATITGYARLIITKDWFNPLLSKADELYVSDWFVREHPSVLALSGVALPHFRL